MIICTHILEILEKYQSTKKCGQKSLKSFLNAYNIKSPFFRIAWGSKDKYATTPWFLVENFQEFF